MAFIRYRKLVLDQDGNVKSGSAAIIDVTYDPDNKANHSRQKVREKLGKVIIYSGKKKGLFQSPTRGLVWYDSEKDEFSPQVTRSELEKADDDKSIAAARERFPKPGIHTVFGDGYLLIEILKKSGILKMLHTAFSEQTDYQRLLAHICYGILRDGSRISCEDFIAKSFLSYLVPDVPLRSLKSDTAYFDEMGKDSAKLAFFQEFIRCRRKKHSDFGKACYIDSTPLPNDIDSPFNALCSHGVTNTSVQMRLALVIDEITLDPIWYMIIPGNVLDFNTIRPMIRDIEISLDIKINSYTLDAGYVTKSLIKAFQIQKEDDPLPEKHYLAHMPAKRGYPYKTLYHQVKTQFGNARYEFIRSHHAYFAREKEITVFDEPVMAYIYIDQYNALKLYTDYRMKNPDVFEKLPMKEQNWYKVKFGYFVLLSNQRKTAAAILDDYFGRSSIETFFKSSKEYLKLLPLCKWTDERVRGKILSDIIDQIIRSEMMRMRKNNTQSISEIIGKTQSLMCSWDSENDEFVIDQPNRQVKDIFKMFRIPVPQQLNYTDYRHMIYV